MMSKKYFVCFWAWVFLFLCMGVSGADLYIESEQISRGIPGQPDGSAVLKQYFSDDVIMLDLGDRMTIMNFKAKTFHELDRTTQTYQSGWLSQMGLESIGLHTQGLDQNALLNSVLTAVVQKATVTPTQEISVISGYTCRKFIVRLLMTDSVYWASKDIDGYAELKMLADRSAEAFIDNPLMRRMNILGLIKDLDGYPVQITTFIGGGSISTILKTVEQKKLDPGLFKVPAAYRWIRNR